MSHTRRLILALLVVAGSVRLASADPLITNGETCPGSNRILVTGGGGIRGAYQAGALWYLVTVLHCDFHHYVGTSTGALTAAMLAQSADSNELLQNVDTLVKIYRELSDKTDIVEERFAAKLRVALPRWLGGVDGIYTLKPLVERFFANIRFESIPPDKITIPVVSLQSGKLHHESEFVIDDPEDGSRITIPPTVASAVLLKDQVLGSASIPVAIEPRRARIWAHGYLISAHADGLFVSTNEPPGLRDRDCELRIGHESFPCQHVETVVEREKISDPFVVETETAGVRWKVHLRAPTLPATARINLQRALKKDSNLRVAFTTLHQLVDGGVTDNIPLVDAFNVWAFQKAKKGKEFDSIFVLTTGLAATRNVENREIRGGLNVGAAALDLLWETYQDTSMSIGWTMPSLFYLLDDARKWIMEAQAWRKRLEETQPAETLRAIDESLKPSRFPKWEPEFFSVRKLSEDRRYPPPLPWVYVIDPEQRIFTDSLDVDPVKIRKALYHGCLNAAYLFSEPNPRRIGNVYMSPTLYLGQYPACDRLKPGDD